MYRRVFENVIFFMASVAAAKPLCASGEWVNLASIPSARQEHGTTASGNTTIAILGGIVPTSNGTETTDLFQLYDNASDTWRAASPAPYKVNHPNIAAVDDKIYLLGELVVGPTTPGLTMNWVASKASYVYDVATDVWSELSPMPNGTEKGSSVVGVYK